MDHGVVNTTDDHCEQQVLSVALRLQQLTTALVRRWLCSIYNTCSLMPSQTEGRIHIYPNLYLKPEYLPRGVCGGGYECGNRINILIMFHSNNGSMLLSFRDMTTGQPSHILPFLNADQQ